jgi:hypothetical protein
MATFQRIILTSNTTNTNAPVASDIDQGELALNLVDGSVYFKDTTDTIREFGFASSNSSTSNPGSISQHISENSNGVGIGIDAAAGFDLNVNGKVKLNDILYAKKIYGDGTNGVLLTAGTTDSNSSQIELSSNAASTHAIHYDADSHVLRTQDGTTYTYAALGVAAPSLSVGGPNTTGLATLHIGDDRTSQGNSQIILRSKVGGVTGEHVAKFIRDTSNNLKILNHTGHVQIHADNDKHVKLISSADNNDSIQTVNLIAKGGKVKIGSLSSSTSVNNNKELEVVGAIKAQNIQLTDDDGLLFGGSGTNRITHNDGEGVFNIRAQHTNDQTENPDDEEYTVNGGGAAYIGAKNLGAISSGGQRIELKVSSDTSAAVGGSVTWGKEVKLYNDKLTYAGKLGLGNATTPGGDIHVAGDGGIDNVIIEANSSDSDGARITLRTTTGTFGSRNNTSNGQKIGEIVAQGYRGGVKSAGRIDWIALNAWTGQTNENAKMLIKVRGLKTPTDSATSEVTAMKVFATDGGKVAINSPVDLTDSNNATLHIGGAQDLGPTKGDFIEHLRLDANAIHQDRLTFRSLRLVTDGETAADSGHMSASQRIQRIVDGTSMGYIDFRSHYDSRSQSGGTNEMIIFGEGNDSSGPNPDARYFSILHDGRLVQYGQDLEARANTGADDLMIGQASGIRGMTILSGSDSKGNIFFADENHEYPGMISYDHAVDRMDISVGSEGYPNGGEVFNGIQITSEGNVGIQLTDSTPTEALHVNGKILAENDITAFSDERLKENIETIPNALEKVSQLRGVEFTRKDTGEKSIGVIAQEIEKVIPEVVSTTNNADEMKSVAYGNVVGLLIEAIKDLQQEVEELKRDVR